MNKAGSLPSSTIRVQRAPTGEHKLGRRKTAELMRQNCRIEKGARELIGAPDGDEVQPDLGWVDLV